MEIIAVLLVMSVIAGVVVTRIISLDAYRIAMQLDAVKIHLRYAQTRARNSGTVYGIDFKGGSYSLFRNGDITDTIVLPGEDVDVVVFPSGMSATEIVSFDSWGSPYMDASAQTAQTGLRTITFYSGGDVQISQDTGFIP